MRDENVLVESLSAIRNYDGGTGGDEYTMRRLDKARRLRSLLLYSIERQRPLLKKEFIGGVGLRPGLCQTSWYS